LVLISVNATFVAEVPVWSPLLHTIVSKGKRFQSFKVFGGRCNYYLGEISRRTGESVARVEKMRDA